MDKLKRIISGRDWYHKSEPLLFFEKRFGDLMELEIHPQVTKASDAIKNEARKQFLVMLITCFETYNRDIFKLLIDKKVISVKQLLKIKKIKDLKYNLEEVEYINDKGISLSEIICETLNFQNLRQLKEIFSLINFKKKMDEIIPKKNGEMPKPDISNYKRNSDIAIDFFKKYSQTRSSYKNADDLLYHINKLLELRHKIVHKNVEIKISQEDVTFMSLAIFQLVLILDKIAKEVIEIRKVHG